MKKCLFAIFAHPDDEAFGAGGSLLLEATRATDIHLVSLTLGEAGSNPDQHADLKAVREHEWQHAGRLLRAKTMRHLGYSDGKLSNTDMIQIGHQLVEHISTILTDLPNDTEVELLTNDTNGITGHIDHIVAARATCWAYYRLKRQDVRITRLRLLCLPRSQASTTTTDWLYMEPGRTTKEIDEVVDARAYHDEIVSLMRAHHSQRADCEYHLQTRGTDLGLNYFKVIT